MSEILPSTSNAASLHGAARNGEAARSARTPHAGAAEAPARAADQVELSEGSRLLGMLRALPEVRADLVERARAEIDAGEFLTDERIDGAVDELARDLDLLS